MIDPCSLSEGDRFHTPLSMRDGQLVTDHDRQATYEVVVSGEHRLSEVPPDEEVLVEITDVGDHRAAAEVVSTGLNGIVDGLGD